MYEYDEEISEGEIKERFQNMIKFLENPDIIKKINQKISEKLGGKIYICFPKMKSQQHIMHFIIDTDNKTLSLFDISEVSAAIKEILNSSSVLVEIKQSFNEKNFDNLFHKLTLLTTENLEKINSFLRVNYPDSFIISSNQLEQQSNQLASSYSTVGMLKPLPPNKKVGTRKRSGEEAFDQFISEQENKKAIVNEKIIADFLKEFLESAEHSGFDKEKIKKETLTTATTGLKT